MRPLLFVLAASCIPQHPLVLPEIEGARSMLMIFSDVNHEKEGIFGVALEDPSYAPISLEETDRFFVLTYPLSLAELGLAPGKIEIVTDAPDRPLPSGYTVYEAPEPDRIAVEIEDDAFREFMGDVQLRGFDVGDCEDLGGCFRLTAGDEFCVLPCTLPEIESPRPPDPVVAHEFEPCPPGWSPALGACAPPDIVGCGAGEAQFLGDVGCTSVAGPCSARYPTGLSGNVAYVDASVIGPGSGTEGDPYRLISSALGADAIALAQGTYSESLAIDGDVEIAGACGRAAIAGSLSISGTVVLRNLSITGAVPLDVTGTLTLRDAEVSGSQSAARVSGGLIAERVLLREGSRGILSSGMLSIDGARIMGGIGPAIHVQAGTADITDLFVTDRTTSAPSAGIGIQVGGGAVTGKQIFLADTAGSGVAVSGAGSRADLVDVAIRDQPTRWLSKHGLDVRNQGTLTAREVLVTDTGEVGVYANNGTAEITGAVLSDIGRPGLMVRGVDGSLTAEQVQIERPHGFGARVLLGTLTLTDVSIEGVIRSRISAEGETQNWDGYGVYAEGPKAIAMTKVDVAGALGIGVGIYAAGSAELTSVRVRLVEKRDQLNARGITLYDTAGTLRQVRIEDIRGIGLDLYAAEQKQLRTDDLSISNVDGVGFTPSVVTVMGSRVEIDGSRMGAIRFDRAALTYSDARFANVDGGTGAFIGTSDNMDYRESFFRLDGARFEQQPTCLALGWYGVIEAQDTVLTGCTVGFQVVVTEEGRERVPEGILFYRNERNVIVPGEG